MNSNLVISIGGSIVVPKEGIDVKYLNAFRQLILQEIKTGRRFIIVVGGGSTARAYQKAASTITHLDPEDIDWLGIHATRLNGHLLRSVFRSHALHRVIKDPTKRAAWTEPIMIAAGWKPGWSTDYVAVRLARKYGSRHIVNLTNIDAVYDKDPSRFKDAVQIKKISWKNFRTIVGDTWSPGANAPFDPIASKLAQKWGMEVAVAQGKDLANLKRIIRGTHFKGTLIRGE